jgi:glutathione synthase
MPGHDVLFVIDPLELLNPAADSSYVMITEALRRGHQPFGVELRGLALDGKTPQAHARPLVLPGDGEALAWGSAAERRPLASFAAVFMRKDPPFDDDYLTATWILEYARGTTQLFNDPAGLRELNEKLSILRFEDLIPDTRVLREESDLRAALDEMGGKMIVKPVFGFGGREILQARDGDPNLGSIFELATHEGKRFTVAQAFIEEASEGDKRILMVDGEAIGAVLRVPARGELRNNFHAGGSPALTELDERDHEICSRVGPYLKKHGQFFVGLDVIGGYLTEINVTSPTGMQEINRLHGLDGGETMQAKFWDAVESKIAGT